MSAFPVAALTDGSGTIALGGSSQAAALANPGRQYLFFQNVSSATLWVDIGPLPLVATQNQPSIQVIAGASLEFSGPSTGVVPTGRILVIGATTGQAFTLKTA